MLFNDLYTLFQKFQRRFLNKSALTFFYFFIKSQTLNPTTLQTIFLKPWPDGMRVSD